MKITFDGHISSTRETELSQEELAEIFEAVKYQFLTHIEYTSSFSREARSYETDENLTIRKLCENHGVDVSYTPDRVSFFTSVLEALGNPYE
jgi:hypothetical protein